jgi:hypothetical protein
MKVPSGLLRKIFPLLLVLGLAGAARADRIELADGSVIVGQLVSAEGGKIKVATDFAGTIEVAQAKVRSFATDQPVNVRLDSGSTVQGRVEPASQGVAIVAANGSLTATPTNVTNLWRVGAKGPDARTWQYEAALAINGRTGGAEKFAGALSFKATLESREDKLIFALAAEQAEDNGVETANRQFASVDYSSFVSANNLWYARTSLEKDEIKQLDLRSSTAFGLGRKLVKNDVQDLEARIGLSYLYETYANGTDFDSPGLDVAFLHTYQFSNGKLSNTLTYTPTFEDFGNFRVHHESSYEMPITASLWKLKLGLTNDYTSMPQPGVDRLDTLYFTSLILNWE